MSRPETAIAFEQATPAQVNESFLVLQGIKGRLKEVHEEHDLQRQELAASLQDLVGSRADITAYPSRYAKGFPQEDGSVRYTLVGFGSLTERPKAHEYENFVIKGVSKGDFNRQCLNIQGVDWEHDYVEVPIDRILALRLHEVETAAESTDG